MQGSGWAWRRRLRRELRRGLPRGRRRFSASRVVRAVLLLCVAAAVLVWNWDGSVGDVLQGGTAGGADDDRGASPSTGPSPNPSPNPNPSAAPSGETWQVVSVTDGDTLVVQRDAVEERVRLLGIDTPERGQCGYDEATAAMTALVGGAEVALVVGSSDDRDRYGRLLRYVEVTVDGATVDAGLRQLEQGLAAEVYDSRIGYAPHDREDAYIAADDAAPDICPDMREH